MFMIEINFFISLSPALILFGAYPGKPWTATSSYTKPQNLTFYVCSNFWLEKITKFIRFWWTSIWTFLSCLVVLYVDEMRRKMRADSLPFYCSFFMNWVNVMQCISLWQNFLLSFYIFTYSPSGPNAICRCFRINM